MKTKQNIVYGLLAVILALTFISCPEEPKAPTITTETLPNGVVGTAYSQTLSATGDTPITWSIESGALPGGLTISSAGVISGTPSTTGTSSFTVKADNDVGSDTKTLSIGIVRDLQKWTAVTDSTFDTWSIIAIAYGNNRFVAVAYFGMSYSEDGASWTAVSDSPFGTSVDAIAYGSNRFVAGGAGMVYSADGITWTAVSDSPSVTWFIRAIAYGNNRFVAGGGGGKMAYSDDNGVTWTAVSNSRFGTSGISDIAYGNNMFVAVGQSGKIAYADWTGE